MDRTVKLRVRVDYATYSALKEVEEEYREVLEDAVSYGLANRTTSFTRIRAGGVYMTEREKHKDLPSHYIYTACEDASERLSSFEKMKRKGRAFTDKPTIKKVTVHLDDHLWKFSLDSISISIKRGGKVFISPTLPKLFWKYYNGGWTIASEARFKSLKGNVVELYIVFRKDEPKPYEPKAFIPVDLNENSVSVLVDGNPILLETNIKKITLGYEYRRRAITTGRSTKDRDVRSGLRRLREGGDRKADIRWKLANLIVKAALEGRSAIVLENLPRNTPEKMIKGIRDPQLRLRIYRSAFSSMKNAIIEKAREYGVPVIPVNPAYTSSTCPIHNCRITYSPNVALPKGWVSARRVVNCGTGMSSHYTT